MKKTIVAFSGPLMLAVLFLLLVQTTHAQIVNEQTRKKVSIGVGLFTDIWNNMPEFVNSKGKTSQFETRVFNQGFQALAMYNFPFGKSDFGFSAGLGFRAENMYVNEAGFKSTKDSTYIVKMADSIDVRRSKLTMPYIELPVEFYFKSTKTKVAVALGFKIGYMFPAHTKYVGENYNYYDQTVYRFKQREILNMETFSYGPTLRIGYRWIHAFGYYSISKIFMKNKGPAIYPITVGLLLMPY
jgi:hypothetical protein